MRHEFSPKPIYVVGRMHVSRHPDSSLLTFAIWNNNVKTCSVLLNYLLLSSNPCDGVLTADVGAYITSSIVFVGTDAFM